MKMIIVISTVVISISDTITRVSNCKVVGLFIWFFEPEEKGVVLAERGTCRPGQQIVMSV